MALDPAIIASIKDPITLAIVSGLVSGTAGSAMSRAIGHGMRWISDRYKGHPKEAIGAAQRNVVNFFGHVNMCLDGQQQIEGIEYRIEQALADPDYTSLFQEAVLGAARTNSEQKHRLLARLVTDRLTAEPESLRNLAAHMACNAIPQLSPIHLRLLGVMYAIHYQPAPNHLKGLSRDALADAGSKWLLEEIKSYMPIGDITQLDFAHLVAVSCITYIPPHQIPLFKTPLDEPAQPREWDLFSRIYEKFAGFASNSYMVSSRIQDDRAGKELIRYWEECDMKKATLTSAGSLIGMYVHECNQTEK